MRIEDDAPSQSPQNLRLPLFGDCLIVNQDFQEQFENYRVNKSIAPLLLLGDVLEVMKELPSDSFDCCMTSPPYWGKREYDAGGIGWEPDFKTYVDNLCSVFSEVHRVLKKTGSFWLNIGDSYYHKNLLGLPWRIALNLTDNQGWILRNSVIWNKVKGGPDHSKDRLRNIHENLFHFVKSPKYYYDIDSIRSSPRKTKVVNGSVVSATGVTGIRYKRKIELSTDLSENEKRNAYQALEEILRQVSDGIISDFRMIIRGQQRTTHSDSEKVSGRAKELKEKGFYFLKYHPKGSKPSDVWEILPEDTQKRELHFAPYPVDLCKIPISSTCPPNGIIIDPFCGTGTTMLVAQLLGRKSCGIDISHHYLEIAKARSETIL
ncbi:MULTISPECIES: DNA-methyltransferase [Limnospira]|uniref:Methyltransferase n=3 Tax=Oscillatoriophycideae TaxID=1301283 RepID=Q307C4_LIMPL|nr:methyltransferase [Arthrospira platensis]AMW27251.1 DNA methyltransferase [Arthrospira platensis YZ]KDR57502.1 DNA methyltransferase [Arthrospira platensis str. Paraca]MBD2575472.1 site-specific DNA-methyltransferase [Arthrospira platensis FACHB-971]MBD2671731.1 site-specific DNA-methyltransferase [Arthrospira platensis FACHB-439]MBD2712651.1 site-specific DNA-methyltransferase [Arthrospira platensis FACHB-835]MDF2211235.1 site-specific DNA-methyltransferase [Arthrospira platensis NCB002]